MLHYYNTRSRQKDFTKRLFYPSWHDTADNKEHFAPKPQSPTQEPYLSIVDTSTVVCSGFHLQHNRLPLSVLRSISNSTLTTWTLEPTS